MSLITCENLALSYEGRCVLQGVNFSLAGGEYLCIVGENGSGKSTLMKALLSLKSPDRGEIRFGDGLRRTEIGYLPQNSAIRRDFPANVGEIVLSGCQNTLGSRLFYGAAARRRARQTMEKLGIAHLSRRPWRELSGGQQQRVLLCRALCATRRLLLLDEPAAGLDPVVTAELYALIREANREGLTVIMVSHDMQGALRDATHVLHLAGHQVYFGPAEEYARQDAVGCFCGGCANA
ncbi:MAG: metal ABC transporter ATP-binding protein [Clostridia bacterium]|nr:metal ABC transporter ATP-binding protein [Clostridia bacterium]